MFNLIFKGRMPLVNLEKWGLISNPIYLPQVYSDYLALLITSNQSLLTFRSWSSLINWRGLGTCIINTHQAHRENLILRPFIGGFLPSNSFITNTNAMCMFYTNVHTYLFNRYNFIPRIQRVLGRNMENIQYQANHNEGGGSIPFL